MKKIKLGILQVNHDKSVEVGDTFPDDAHRFRDLFDEQEDRFQYRIYMTIGGELPQDLNEQDAFMITGSPLSVLDHHIFTDGLADFIKRCDEAKKPLMGACFGHQAIAQALGGKVEKTSDGYNVGVEDTRFRSHRSWMQPQLDRIPMYMFHEDQVTELPAECDLLGSSDGCKIASFAKGNHLFTTQAHPEFSHGFMSCVLKYMEGNLQDQNAEAAWHSLQQQTQGSLFADWCTRFFKGQ